MEQAGRLGFALNVLVYLVEDWSAFASKEISKRPLLLFLREEEALFGNKLRESKKLLYDMAISSLVEMMQEACL